MKEHQRVFSFGKKDLNAQMDVEFHIDTGNTPPIAQRAYRDSPAEKAAIDEEINSCRSWA